jgi:hypothetical protein
MRSWNRLAVFTLLSISLIAAVGCGGGKSTPTAPATYTVGGSITGLTGTGLVLQNSGGSNLTVSAKSTSFTFTTAVASGGAYSVTVLTQPAGQNCAVNNGSGTSTANVTTVSIACNQAYTIGGSVLGLSGTGLVLQDNGGDNLAVAANATSFTFTFAGPIPQGGASYSVTVLTNPAGQACTVANNSGTATASVANVNVACTSVAGVTYTVGGTVTGLTGPGLVLQDHLGSNDDDLLPVSENGSFAFANPAASGGAFSVTVLTQPNGRSCAVSNGSGTATANVTDVSVACVGEWTWRGGSSTVGNGRPGVYGMLGKPAPANVLGGRKHILSWTDASGNAWLFGGEGYDSAGTGGLLNDLWKFDPNLGAEGEWAWMGGSDLAPASSSYGEAGQAGVYGTLGTASPRNVPGGRDSSASWVDSSGNAWIFAGFGLDSLDNGGALNDLWKFDPTLGAYGEWTWMGGSNTGTDPNEATDNSAVYGTLGTPASTNIPGKRYSAVSWVDSSGNFWLLGGFGSDLSGYAAYLNDLWKYAPSATGNTGEWTWMGGSSTHDSSVQCQSVSEIVYGTLGTPASTNIPGGRNGAVNWVDSAGNVWLFGGYGCDSTGAVGYLNDLWRYTPGQNGSAGEWTWMGGSSTIGGFYGPSGVYGTQGIPAATNVPGGRLDAVSWVDASGNLWLFGGNGVDSTGTGGQLNDLWKYVPSATGDPGEWTWMSGSTTLGPFDGQSGVCGMLGSAAAANDPGGRDAPVGWRDASGNFWILGGQGFDCGTAGSGGYLNDVWEYQP